MNQYNTHSKPKQFQRPMNFIEALKDLGSSMKTQATDATLGTGKGVMDQLFGSPTPNNKPSQQSGELAQEKPFNFEDFLKSRERQTESIQRQRYERRLKDEKMVYSRKEEEVKMQIKSIQEELKKIAAETIGLSDEVKQAVFQGTVNPGIYHLNFFERLRSIIELARKQIAQSKTWMEAFNHRKKQQHAFYWSNVKKSGTKYMLSQERYMSTQAG